MRWAGFLLVAALTACAAPCPTRPEPAPQLHVQRVPVGLLEREPEPVRPAGDYTQRDVARYLGELHRWGRRGWDRLIEIQEWSDGRD